MLLDETLRFEVEIPVKNLDGNKKILTSAIAEYLLIQLNKMKACDSGYFLSLTKLIRIGPGDSNSIPEHVVFPVECRCRMLKPVGGEVMTGVVYKVYKSGVFIKSGPMTMVCLPDDLMPNYSYVAGTNRAYVGVDLSRIECGVLVRFRVFYAAWVDNEYREFRVFASIKGDGLGPVSMNGYDGIESDEYMI
ncbi:hypothetical protein ABFS82_07G040900 [Erythranthe guttata]